MDGQRAVLAPTALAAMQHAGLGDYGLGWSINANWSKHREVWHSGAMPGSSATLWLVPAEKIAIALVANQIGAPVNQLAGEILAGLVPAGEPSKESRAPDEARPSTSAPAPAAADAPVGRFRGKLLTCSKPEALAIDVRGSREAKLTIGTASDKPLEGARLDGGRLSGTFSGPTGSRESEYRLDLRVVRERLEGPVTRRTSLGPRANVAVTLWAELERER